MLVSSCDKAHIEKSGGVISESIGESGSCSMFSSLCATCVHYLCVLHYH